MCFSAQASFITAVVLTPLGVYGFLKALKSQRRFLLLSLIPLMFAIQQALEGMVWLGFSHHALSAMYQNGLEFVFVAFFIWPIYLPLCVYCIERDVQRRKILRWFPVMGLLYGLSIFIPFFMGDNAFSVSIFNHSIAYQFKNMAGLSLMYGFIYLMITVFPFFYTSEKILKLFGALALVSVSIAMCFYYYTLTSVWCFFVALMSGLVVYAIQRAEN